MPTAGIPQLVNHLHLPVQARLRPYPDGEKRGYTALEFKIAATARHPPDLRLASDFIIGFPARPRPTMRR